MLDYPLVFTIRVLDELSGQGVAQIAVMVTFFAAKKNDYHIGRVTDSDGEIALTIDEVRQSIVQDQQLFIMDYASALEECSAEIKIEVLDSGQLKRIIEGMELYKDVTGTSDNLINSFKHSNNSRYVVPVGRRVEMGRNVDSVQIMIRPKRS